MYVIYDISERVANSVTQQYLHMKPDADKDNC